MDIKVAIDRGIVSATPYPTQPQRGVISGNTEDKAMFVSGNDGNPRHIGAVRAGRFDSTFYKLRFVEATTTSGKYDYKYQNFNKGNTHDEFPICEDTGMSGMLEYTPYKNIDSGLDSIVLPYTDNTHSHVFPTIEPPFDMLFEMDISWKFMPVCKDRYDRPTYAPTIMLIGKKAGEPDDVIVKLEEAPVSPNDPTAHGNGIWNGVEPSFRTHSTIARLKKGFKYQLFIKKDVAGVKFTLHLLVKYMSLTTMGTAIKTTKVLT